MEFFSVSTFSVLLLIEVSFLFHLILSLDSISDVFFLSLFSVNKYELLPIVVLMIRTIRAISHKWLMIRIQTRTFVHFGIQLYNAHSYICFKSCAQFEGQRIQSTTCHHLTPSRLPIRILLMIVRRIGGVYFTWL